MKRVLQQLLFQSKQRRVAGKWQRKVAEGFRVWFLLLIFCPWSFVWGQTSAETPWPSPEWPKVDPETAGMDRDLLEQARDYALTGEGSGMIIRNGKLVLSWGDLTRRYDLKSTTKSLAGATTLGLAIGDGKASLDQPAVACHPEFGIPPEENADTGWLDDVTLLHLATHTAGFDKNGGYMPLLFEPGTKWFYSDGGPNWLAECLTLTYGVDLNALLFERVFSPLGITPDDLAWRNNSYRPHEIGAIMRREFGSGVHANVDAMARIGYLYLRGGRWKDRQILPADFIEQARRPVPGISGVSVYDSLQFGENSILNRPSEHYGLLWWNNADETIEGVPLNAYWSWGLYESLIVVIPSLDLVVARAGRSWEREPGMAHYDILEPFLIPIVASVRTDDTEETGSIVAPYPNSPVIETVNWAPQETIVHLAEGSDNWPLTWGDDDALYTAYGDGWGFEPKVSGKLSLGLARIEGTPPDIRGINLRSPSAEQYGGGAAGKKASGMLMVDGTLYMWVRNAGNAQLAWSKDRGKTWTWADWKFTTSFGAPTFLNFGRNYAGARDDYVYIYSHDSNSAYEPADRMVLARVPKGRITDRTAYTFFKSLNDEGEPVWTEKIEERGAVFENPGRCYRSGISYNAGLKRYIWSQPLPGDDIRFRGGFGIYDAPEPWGPWTTVYFTPSWDVGPGETMSFPIKWMSPDGKTAFLVSSSEDYFSVRKATFTLK